MVYSKIDFGEEEVNALMKLSMETPQIKKQRKTLRILFLIMAVCICVLAWSLHQIFLVLVGIVFAVTAFVGVRPIQVRSLQKVFDNLDEKLKSGIREYVFNEEGVKITSEFTSGLSKWEVFEEAGELDNYIWLRRVDNQVILVKKDSLTEEKAAELYTYLENVKKGK